MIKSITPSVSVRLTETGRGAKAIFVVPSVAIGTKVNNLELTDDLKLLGLLSGKVTNDSDFKISILLKDPDTTQYHLTEIDAKFLPGDLVFFGHQCGTDDGIILYSDQEGGYILDIYKGNRNYTEAWYNHLLRYNDWSLKNGYPQVERTEPNIRTICDAFPLAA